jgi:hypothetical protein
MPCTFALYSYTRPLQAKKVAARNARREVSSGRLVVGGVLSIFASVGVGIACAAAWFLGVAVAPYALATGALFALGAALLCAAYVVSPRSEGSWSLRAAAVAVAAVCTGIVFAVAAPALGVAGTAATIVGVVAVAVFGLAALWAGYSGSPIEFAEDASEETVGCLERIGGSCGTRIFLPLCRALYLAATAIGCAYGLVMFTLILHRSIADPLHDVRNAVMASGALLLAFVCGAAFWIDLPAPAPPRPAAYL